MSLLSLLSIARSALLVQQRAMGVTGHNIANAGVPGYHRQRLEIHAAPDLRTPAGTVGRGVESGPVLRSRDTLLDAAFRRASGEYGWSSTSSDVLSRVETAFGEPSEHGVASAFDALFASFSALASDPAGAAARIGVRDAAAAFTARLRALDGELSALSAETLARARAQVDEVNALAGQLADLNARILAASGPLGGAPDLADARDRVLDRLAELTGGRAIEGSNGTVAFTVGDALLVDAGSARQLEVRTTGAGFTIARTGDPGSIGAPGGALGAIVALQATLTTRRNDLDALAAAVVTQVNTIHAAGSTPGGVQGLAFFDPAGVTAGTIALDAGVLASIDNIATGSVGSPGDGDTARRIAALADGPLAALGGRTLRSLYTDVAAAAGSDAAHAAADAAADAALAGQADEQRASLFGVSVDEEMVTLIAQQQAYAAAARLVRVADEMMQELLKIA